MGITIRHGQQSDFGSMLAIPIFWCQQKQQAKTLSSLFTKK